MCVGDGVVVGVGLGCEGKELKGETQMHVFGRPHCPLVNVGFATSVVFRDFPRHLYIAVASCI